MATKTITLNGAEQRIDSLGGLNALIVNNTTEVLYASAKSGVVPYADDVIEIKAGDTRTLLNANGAVYLLGSGGRVEVTGGINFSSPSQPSGGGGGVTSAEVNSIVTEKIAEVVANAPEDFDTLKEISDWIEGHEDSAAAMNSKIQENATNITSLQSTVDNKADKSEIPAALPADGGNAATVNNHTVCSDVPADAKFTDTTYSNMTAATANAAGKAGLVPAPAAGAQGKYLRGDGAWANVDADTVDGYHAKSFLGHPDYSYAGYYGGKDINDIVTTFHGFVYNCQNHPSTYGFLDVQYFNGTGFIPGKVICQVWTDYASGVTSTRTKVGAGGWTAWRNVSSVFTKSGANAKAGLVPAPSTTAGTTKYLREDATWSEISPNQNFMESPDYSYKPYNSSTLGKALNDLTTTFHGFMINFADAPSLHGFLDVYYFDGTGFGGSGGGAVSVQQWRVWSTGKIFTRSKSGTTDWTNWI